MKNQDDLRKEMVLLSARIEACNCPETKTLLLKRARVLLASSQKSKVNEAKARIDRLNSALPKIYRDNPHALVIIEEKQPGFEKFLPHRHELEKGKRMQDQIKAIASQFNIELVVKSTERKSDRTITRRNKRDKFSLSNNTQKYCKTKFKRLSDINATIDNKDESMETRSAFNKGKKALVGRETEFNGTRRNDKQTNNRMSWNPEGAKLAGAKGAK